MKSLCYCSSYMSLLFGVSLDMFISTGLFEQTKSNSIKVKYTVDSDMTFFLFLTIRFNRKKNRHWVKYCIGWDLFFIYSSLSVFDKPCDYEGNVLLYTSVAFHVRLFWRISKQSQKGSHPWNNKDNRSAHIWRHFSSLCLLSLSVLWFPFLAQSKKDK